MTNDFKDCAAAVLPKTPIRIILKKRKNCNPIGKGDGNFQIARVFVQAETFTIDKLNDKIRIKS